MFLNIAIFLIILLSCGIDGIGISSHIDVGYRSRNNFDLVSDGVNYETLLRRHEDAFQAGCPYPDAYYPGLCFDGIYHDIAEDTHWTPFLEVAIKYIRDRYPKPWNIREEKLVTFLLGIVQHQVTDVNWHSLGINQGFLRTMANLNYHGSFNAAHGDGDFGADVINLFELDMDYIGLVTKWWVPTEDLVNIYQDYYGEVRMTPDVVENCTMWLYLGRLGENIGVIELLYPLFARASPFLADRLNDYYLGGMDDMAVWTSNVWQHTVDMLDHGTEICELPNNPIYIRCNTMADDMAKRSRIKRESEAAHAKQYSFDLIQQKMEKLGIDESQIEITREHGGITLEPGPELMARLSKLETKQAESRYHPGIYYGTDVITPDVFYDTNIDYSRVGEYMISGDLNNDGFDDIIISAPVYATSQNFQRGRVYVIYGSADGLPEYNLNIEDTADIILTGPKENGRFGTGLAIVDINADGINDLAVSAPSVGSKDLNFQGELYVYIGTDDNLEHDPSMIITCTMRYCNLGWTLSSGDLNDDGFNDLVVGSPFAPVGGEQRGFVAVLYGDDKYNNEIELNEEDFDWRWNGGQDYQWLGYSAAVVERSNANLWLVAGSPTYRICMRPDCGYDNEDIQSVGLVYMFDTPLPDTATVVIIGKEEFQQLGFSVSGGRLGDKDVVAIASATRSYESANRTQAGHVGLYDMDNIDHDALPVMSLWGEAEYGRFGDTVLITDVDSNGSNEVIVSCPMRSENITTLAESGVVFVFGEDDISEETSAESATMVFGGEEEQARFGSSVLVATVGDKKYLISGSEHSNSGSRLGGQVSVIPLEQGR